MKNAVVAFAAVGICFVWLNFFGTDPTMELERISHRLSKLERKIAQELARQSKTIVIEGNEPGRISNADSPSQSATDTLLGRQEIVSIDLVGLMDRIGEIERIIDDEIRPRIRITPANLTNVEEREIRWDEWRSLYWENGGGPERGVLIQNSEHEQNFESFGAEYALDRFGTPTNIRRITDERLWWEYFVDPTSSPKGSATILFDGETATEIEIYFLTVR